LTDAHLIAKKLGHTLQIAIQAALDAAGHVVADERLGEPRSYADLFGILAATGWIDAQVAAQLRRMAGFRNLLVHGYVEIDPARVQDVVEHHLGDLDAFVAALRARLPG
jgi:uncharacterized protein YutE (UPF0331/DUF86 family)